MSSTLNTNNVGTLKNKISLLVNINPQSIIPKSITTAKFDNS